MPKPLPTTRTHDTLFKALVSSRHAAILLRDHLPAGLAALLADAPPRAMSDDYRDKTLRHSRSDLLFEVRLKDGGTAFLLFEHKSRPDPGTPLQLLGYANNIWRRYLQGRPGRRRALPPIIPLVFYHGAAKWSAPLSLAESMAGDGRLRRYVELRYRLRDFGQIPLAKLSAAPMPRFGFVAMYYAGRKPRGKAAMRETLESVLRWWPQEEPDSRDRDLENQIFVYIMSQFGTDFETLHRLARAIHPHPQRGGTRMKSIAEKLEEKGRKAGLAEGKIAGLAEGKIAGLAEGKLAGLAEGEAKGLAASLTRLLQHRFGPLSAAAQARIAAASAAELGGWLDQALDAPSLEAIFGDAPRR